MEQIVEIQPLFLALVLAWAGGYKLTGRGVRASAARSALGRLVGPRTAHLGYRVTGGAELVVATLLLLPPVRQWEASLAAALAISFAAYLFYARLTAPESSCGCLSADARPVSWRALSRAALLIAAALTATNAQAFPGITFGAVFVLAAELALLVALSPDLDRIRRRLAGEVRARLQPHPLAAHTAGGVPLAAALSQLHRSELYCTNSALLCSDVQDAWEAEGYTILSYAGRLEAAPVTVVFAIPKRYAPDEIRMSLVETALEQVPS